MKQLLKKPGFWILFTVVCVLTLLGLHRTEQLEKLHNQPNRVPAAINVNAQKSQIGTIGSWVCGEGTVTAVKKRHLLFQANGNVAFTAKGSDNKPLKEGTWVTKGTHLAELDNREIKQNIELIKAELSQANQELNIANANHDQAKHNLVLAKKQYERTQGLYNRQIKSLSVFEQDRLSWLAAESEVKTAMARVQSSQASIKGLQARLNQAKIQLENTSIYAPFEGIIARLNITRGDYFDQTKVDQTNPASLLETAPITIVDPTELEVTVNLPIFQGANVKPGQQSVIMWGSMDWQNEYENNTESSNIAYTKDLSNPFAIPAKVYSVSPVLSIIDRTVKIKIRAELKHKFLPHGMFVSCWIKTEQKTDALLIPTQSLLFENGQAYVYTIKQETAHKKQIKTGIEDRNKIEVLEGLDPNQTVVTRGRYRLFQGCRVKIIPKSTNNNG